MIKFSYEDMKSTLRDNEISRICLGSGKGLNKAKIALNMALNSQNLKGATRALWVLRCSENTQIDELNECTQTIKNALFNCEIIIDIEVSNELNDEVQVIIIATGFKYQHK